MMREQKVRDGWRLPARLLAAALTASAWFGAAAAAGAESETPQSAALAAAEADRPVLDSGDHAWILTSSALVLMMTAPGLAMFYSGLVRKKNVLGVIMQCIFLMAMMTVIWALYGYSLAFGGSGPWIGNGEFLLMRNVQMSGGAAPMEGSIPRLTHMLFQGMFFIITPALIVGAFAERMKFSTMVVFMILWGTFVYCPLCHWVWDGGILFDGNEYFPIGGALDFAGGTVVHISSGISALVCALLIGPRLGLGSQPMPPHNLTYTALGAAMLWVGWFGFNAGSALGASGLAASAFAATHFAAASGGLAWSACEWLLRGRPSLLGACSGVVAGLVCITPGSGLVQPISGIFIGLAAGAGCFFACTTLKARFRYDDALDVFGVHGVGGTLGALLTGVFATRHVKGGSAAVGLLEGGSAWINQIVATAITWGLAIVVTFVLLKILDATIGLRVSQQEEIQGLDLSQHGEEGYIFI